MFARNSILALTFGLLIASSLSARESDHTRTAPSKSPILIETNTLERLKFELEQPKFELERSLERSKLEQSKLEQSNLEQSKLEQSKLEQSKFELEQSKFEFERQNESLGHFKDWSNYLLVTTVAALGWVAANEELLTTVPFLCTIFFFCLSIILAIFTLALIPIVGENITVYTKKSIFEIPASFNLFWVWESTFTLTLKSVCWPQHVSFLVGIVSFSAGSIC